MGKWAPGHYDEVLQNKFKNIVYAALEKTKKPLLDDDTPVHLSERPEPPSITYESFVHELDEKDPMVLELVGIIVKEIATRRQRGTVDVDPGIAPRMSDTTVHALRSLCARSERYPSTSTRRVPEAPRASTYDWYTHPVHHYFDHPDSDNDEHDMLAMDDIPSHASAQLHDAYYSLSGSASNHGLGTTPAPIPSWQNRWGSSIDLPPVGGLDATTMDERIDRDLENVRLEREASRRLMRRPYLIPPSGPYVPGTLPANRARMQDFRSFTLRRRTAGRAAAAAGADDREIGERGATEDILDSLYPRHSDLTSTSSSGAGSSHVAPRSISLRRSFDPVRDAMSREEAPGLFHADADDRSGEQERRSSPVPASSYRQPASPRAAARSSLRMRSHTPPLRRGGIRAPELSRAESLGRERDERWSFDSVPMRLSPLPLPISRINYEDLSEPPRPRDRGRGASPPLSPPA